MAISPLDIELSKYWSLLSPDQKKSLLEVIKSFIQTFDESHQQLQEAEPNYGSSDFYLSRILQQLNQHQKRALILLLKSFKIQESNQRISIEQYNKELDEAEAEFERGEFISHEEVIKMSKKWINGK